MIYHIKSYKYTYICHCILIIMYNVHTHQLPCHFMLDLLVVDQICRHEAQCRQAWNQHWHPYWHHSALPGKQPVLGGRSVFVRPISQSSWLEGFKDVHTCSRVQSFVISIDHWRILMRTNEQKVIRSCYVFDMFRVRNNSTASKNTAWLSCPRFVSCDCMVFKVGGNLLHGSWQAFQQGALTSSFF